MDAGSIATPSVVPFFIVMKPTNHLQPAITHPMRAWYPIKPKARIMSVYTTETNRSDCDFPRDVMAITKCLIRVRRR